MKSSLHINHIFDFISPFNMIYIHFRNLYQYDFFYRFLCLPGYRPVRYVIGSVTGGNTVNILCDGSGTWQNDGYCEKITCPPLSMINAYLYTCSDGHRYQSICSTNCMKTKVKYF